MKTTGIEVSRTPAISGTVCLLIGFALAMIVLTIRLDADWGRFGNVVGRNPILCWGISVGLMLGGVLLIKQASHPISDWSPELPGPRFRRAVLYTRQDCPLCEEALKTLRPYGRYLPTIEVIEIDKEPDLQDDYGDCVPVLKLDDRVRFRGHINETLLRRLIEGAVPLPALSQE